MAPTSYYITSTAVTTPSYWDTTASNGTYWDYPQTTAATSITIPINAWTPILTQWYPSSTPLVPETAEEKKKRLKAQRKWLRDWRKVQKKLVAQAAEAARLTAERCAKEEAEQKVAADRAEELLKSHVGLERYGLLYQVGHLEVDSSRYAGRRYRIRKDAHQRILVLEGDKVVDELCIISRVSCPSGDMLLSKIVMAESAEEEMLKVANHTANQPDVAPVNTQAGAGRNFVAATP